jgi:hypothetical protein
MRARICCLIEARCFPPHVSTCCGLDFAPQAWVFASMHMSACTWFSGSAFLCITDLELHAQTGSHTHRHVHRTSHAHARTGTRTHKREHTSSIISSQYIFRFLSPCALDKICHVCTLIKWATYALSASQRLVCRAARAFARL